MRAIRLKLVALLTVWLLAATGCHRLPASWTYAWQGYPDQGVDTPFAREQSYQQLAAKAAQQSPAEQEQTSQMLAQAYSTEQFNGVRGQIVRTLGHYPTPVAGETLKKALTDPHEHVRRSACIAWGRRGGPDAVQGLAQVLRNEKNADVRKTAVAALGQIREPSPVPALAIALEDSDVAIQHRAMTSLESVTGRYYGVDVNAWRSFAQGQEVAPKDRSIAERVHEYIYR